MPPATPAVPRHRASRGHILAAAPLLAAIALVLGGCSSGSAPGGAASTTSSASPSSSSSASATRPSSARGTTLAAEDLRFLITCSHVDNAPDISRYSLEEVWASTNYVRIKECTVAYQGSRPYEPQGDETAVVDTALHGQATGDAALDAVLEAMRLCTRIPDETGPEGFAAASRDMLRAAATLCPDAPQGKIIHAWASGERFGDGAHTVGPEIAAGDYAAVNPAESCRWAVTSGAGAQVASGGAAEASTVTLDRGSSFSSDNCGIWRKM
ncbi:hypothetical protein [Sinomonas atrocyanea]|uniref:hypothetical protein n=1 Tax=Sinomonas atrocyanea TaxID=37927 RepID=UPI003D997A66